MKKEINSFSTMVASNIIKILKDRDLKQAYIARKLEIAESQVSKKLSGKAQITLEDLSEFAQALSIKEIDIITYPDVYVKKEKSDSEPVEAILQIKLQKDKKDQVLKLIFGDNNIEILNKLSI